MRRSSALAPATSRTAEPRPAEPLAPTSPPRAVDLRRTAARTYMVDRTCPEGHLADALPGEPKTARAPGAIAQEWPVARPIPVGYRRPGPPSAAQATRTAREADLKDMSVGTGAVERDALDPGPTEQTASPAAPRTERPRDERPPAGPSDRSIATAEPGRDAPGLAGRVQAALDGDDPRAALRLLRPWRRAQAEWQRERHGERGLLDLLRARVPPPLWRAGEGLEALADIGLSGPYVALPHRAAMERVFGRDLHEVRAVAGGSARLACELAGAHAFTLGRRIAFADAAPDRALVAHELVHVFQHATRRDGPAALDTSGEADALLVERLVAGGRPLLVDVGAAPLAAADARRSGPALRSFLGSSGPDKPTRVRLSTVESSVKGQTVRADNLEFQIKGIPPIKIQPHPLITLQVIPELRFLATRAEVFGSTLPDSRFYRGTISARLICLVSGGVQSVAEVFGSLTGFVDGSGTYQVFGEPPDVETQLYGEVIFRVHGRYGIRALRRLLEYSKDGRVFSLGRVTVASKQPRGSSVESGRKTDWKFHWGEDAERWAAEIERYVGLARSFGGRALAALGFRPPSPRQIQADEDEVPRERLIEAPDWLRPALLAIGRSRDRLNPANWSTDDLHIVVYGFGRSLFGTLGALDTEGYVKAAHTRLDSLGFGPDMIASVADALTAALRVRGQGAFSFTAASIGELTPIEFIDALEALRLVRLRGDLANTEATENPAAGATGGGAAAPASAAAVQRRQLRPVALDAIAVRTIAARGTHDADQPLPFAAEIQRSFGSHDLARIRVRRDVDAARACDALGARAYALGDRIAFADPPDLRTAAHEATHAVMQAAGVGPEDGIGRPGDRHEQLADAVAERVVHGAPAHDLLAAAGAPAGPPADDARVGPRHGAPDPGEPVGSTAREADPRPPFTGGDVIVRDPGSDHDRSRRTARSTDRPLDASLRAAAGPCFGVDLGRVAVHSKPDAALAARRLAPRVSSR